MIRITCIVLALAGAALAQESSLSLLGTRTAVRPPRPAVRVPLTDRELRQVTLLARVIGAELGPDAEAPLETRIALGAAALRLARHVSDRAFDEVVLVRMRERYPRLCAQDYDQLATRSRDWLIENGYDLSVAAAQKVALEGADTSDGAAIWSDLLDEPARAQRERYLTVSLPTIRGEVAFYR